MNCPRCRRALPDGASLCRGCGLLLDEALEEDRGAGSGFTAPGVSIHAILPVRSTRSGFADAPRTLPPEFDAGDDDEGVAPATIIDSDAHRSLSQARRPEQGEREPPVEEATLLSSVPDAVLQHLRSEAETGLPDDDGMVFEATVQATEKWERPVLPDAMSEPPPEAKNEVGADDATVVRRSPYSNVHSDARTPSSDAPRR